MSYFLFRFMSHSLILLAWKLTIYDMERVKKYDIS